MEEECWYPTDPVWLDNLRTSQAMTPEQRMLAGPRLFEFACAVERSWIRATTEGATAGDVEGLLRRRIEDA